MILTLLLTGVFVGESKDGLGDSAGIHGVGIKMIVLPSAVRWKGKRDGATCACLLQVLVDAFRGPQLGP